MKLSVSVGTSLGCGAVVAAAAWQYISSISAEPGLWQESAFAVPWAWLGGAGGVGVVIYAVLSFALVTAGGLHDLGRARTRLGEASSDPKRLPAVWRHALAATDFETLSVLLPGEDLAIAPLALRRVLRHEIGRIYGIRLIATQIVTAALAVLASATAPYWGLAAPAQTGGMRLGGMIGVLALAAVMASWLLIDRAIDRLAATVSRIAAAWEATLRDEQVASQRGVGLEGAAAPGSGTIAAIGRLAASIGMLSTGEGATPAPAITAIETAVRQSAERQEALIGKLCETLTAQVGGLARTIERQVPSPGNDAGGMGEALTELAKAVDRLADPLLRRSRLLDATDRKVLTVLRRQEEAVGSVGTKWGELAAALKAMSTGLDSVARAAASRQDHDLPLLPIDAGEPAALTEELQELLDEMSDAVETRSRRSLT